MKKTVFFFLLIAFSYILSRSIIADRGYVLFSWGSYTLETSLFFFIFIMSVLVLCSLFLKHLMLCFVNLISVVYPMTVKTKNKRLQAKTTQGMIYYMTGQWELAQKLLEQSANAGLSPIVTYLLAAKAAHKKKDYESCFHYLNKVQKTASNVDFAIDLTRAKFLFHQGQTEKTLAILKKLRKKSPHQVCLLRLLKKTYLELKDWNALAKLLPLFKKYKIVNTAELQNLYQDVYSALFDQAYQEGKKCKDVKEAIKLLKNVWRGMDYQYRKNSHLVYEYARILMKIKAYNEAENFMRRYIGDHYHVSFIKLYSDLQVENPTILLSTMEKLLASHPSDPYLLLYLGKVCIRYDLKEKGEQYLKHCLSLESLPEAYVLMGNLCANQGLYEKSVDYFQQSHHI